MTNGVNNTVSVISDSANAVVATVGVGSNPSGVDYDDARGEVFAANSGDNTVSVISPGSLSSNSTTAQEFPPASLAVVAVMVVAAAALASRRFHTV